MSDFIPDYSRQIRLAGVGEAGQQRLAASRILVIGAGGLGSAVLPLLAGAGVGELTIVDHDQLEKSNLHRQTLYRAEQVGQPKAELAAASVRALNPAIKVSPISQKLNASELLRQLEAHDMLLECTDDFAHKLMANDAAVLLRKPAVFANAVQREGQLQTYTGEEDSACLRCLWPEVPRNTLTCEATGVLGSVPAMIGSLQATESLQLLLSGTDDFVYQNLKNKVLFYDAATYSQNRLALNIRPDCQVHGKDYDREKFLMTHDSMEFSGSFNEAIEQGFTVVDIRDPESARANPLPIPCMVKNAESLAADEAVNSDEPVLLVCYMGRTSLAVAARLREMGFENVFSKAGGANSG